MRNGWAKENPGLLGRGSISYLNEQSGSVAGQQFHWDQLIEYP